MNQELSTKTGRFLTFVILISFVSGMIGSALIYKFAPYIASSKSSIIVPEGKLVEHSYIEESQSISAIKKVSPAVVSIIATHDYKQLPQSYSEPFGNFPGFEFSFPEQENSKKNSNGVITKKISGGSGFIITAEGLVLTNGHVVSAEDVDYTIISTDGTEYDGDVISIDPLNDLAVLQMVKKGELKKEKTARSKLTNLPIVELGDSGILEVGQNVLAIGYALGQYQNTVTSGIISAKGREITASSGNQIPELLSGLLQTDAAINPGNSGGPLINLSGQVIGINVAIDATGSSIGFAIPINDVKPVFESIKKNGRIIRPSLGVRHIILTKGKAAELEINVDHGALLVGDESKGQFAVIPGSGAEKAGLKIKDVILSVDGKDINIDYSLQQAIRNHQPGDEITLQIWRDGQAKLIKVKLDEAKSSPSTNNQ